MSEAKSLTYVVSRWGEPTQTFVRREAEALLERGIAVSVISLKRPYQTDLDARITVGWKAPLLVVLGLLPAVFKSPRHSLAQFAQMVRLASWRTMPRHAAAIAVGLAWRKEIGRRRNTVHAHFGWVAATAAWAMSPIRFGVTLHAFELYDRRKVDAFTPVPLRDAAQLFAISERDRSLIEERWALSSALVRMGVPDDWLTRDEGARDPNLVVSVGSLVAKKGHDLLIQALAASQQPWRCVIVGEGPERANLESQVVALDDPSRISLVGLMREHEVRELLRTASIFVLACRSDRSGDRDGIPVALMEAMACGVAVITTRVGGIEELVCERVGRVVEPEDVSALVRSLEVLADPEVRAELSRAARDEIADKWVVSRAALPMINWVLSDPANPVAS